MKMIPLLRFGRLFSHVAVTGFILLASNSNLTPAAAQDEKPVTSDKLAAAAHFQHLTSDDGLVQNSIESILQDRQGFIWIGTQAGLSRFDGYRFTTYQHNPNDTNSLTQSWVRDLFEDKDGMIWIGTEAGGVNRLDPQTETFTHYLPDPNNPNSLGGDRIFHSFQDSTGNFWFTGGGITGVNIFNPTTQVFTHHAANPNDANGFRGDAVWDAAEDDQGNVWLPAGTTLAQYNLETKQFAYYPAPVVNGKPDNRINVIRRDGAGRIWLGGSGLYRFDPVQGTFTQFPGITGVTAIVNDANGLFWIGTGNGLYQFDPQNGEILQHFTHDATQADGLNTDRISSLYLDREGVLWVGTVESGLNVYDTRQSRFAHYRHNPDLVSSLADGAITSMFTTDQDGVWVGIQDKLDFIDLAKGSVTHYTPQTADGKSLGAINAIYQDHNGIVWLGAGGLSLYQFDFTTNESKPYPLKSNVTRPSPPKQVVGLYEDKTGVMWAAVNQDGLYRLDPGGGTPQFYESPAALGPAMADLPPDKIPHPPITNIIGDREGYVWVSTLNGFSRFDPATGTYTTFSPSAGQESGAGSYIEATLEDHNGVIWAASRDGLVRLNTADQTFTYYTQKDGLSSDYVVSVLEDARGNLWLGTKKGLSRFTAATETFRNFDVLDGLQGTEFSAHAYGQTSDGRMIFGGTNGLTAFKPQDVTDNPYNPPVVLTGFQLGDDAITPTSPDSPLSRPIWETNSLTLTHDQDNFSFEFAALSFAAARKTHYRYMLEGYDEKWKEADSTRRFASYTNLPAGNYTLRVEGTNSDGLWSNQQARLSLTILPPWWEETWFRAVVLILLVGIVYGVYRWRVYAIERRNRDLEQEVARQTSTLQQRTLELQTSEGQLRQAKDAAETANRAKSAFIANMSHELRSPLNAILGFTQVTNRTPALPHEVYENLGIILRSGEHLLNLINQVLDLSKIEAGQMILNEVDFDLYRLLDDVEDMFVLAVDDKHLDLIFERSDDVPHFVRTDSVKLRQILINLIGNAIKFTESGSIHICVRKSADNPLTESANIQLQFEVKDTGAGIADDELSALFEAFTQTASGRKAQEGTGLGLTISRKFARLMGGDITVKSQVGQGTTFAFQIQCQPLASIDNQDVLIQQQVVGLEVGQPVYRVLAVDDRWANRQLLLKLLKPLGFDLREAENGEEAVKIAQAFQPHLIFMDMRMPGISGLEATHQIKATPSGQSIAIIALTASAFEEDRTEIIAAGCDDFLRKPFRNEAIFGMMSKHIGVRYVYADKLAKATLQAERVQPKMLIPAMNKLPQALREAFIEAIELGDVTMLDSIISEIGQIDKSLSESLVRLASHFRYDEMLSLVKEVVQ
ncbi:MAG: two-component regulator propeller domain-containing protein [Chloroflexota bacterium]